MGGVQAKSRNKNLHSSDVASDTVDGAYAAFDEIPDDIILEVFLRLPLTDLKSCFKVCKRFAALLDMRGFWLQKCVRDFKFSKNLLHSLSEEEDLRRLYIKRPYERNLIKNCDASQDMKHWKVTKSGGDGWQVEKEPIGSHPLSQFTRTDGPVGCWATSYGCCHKYQIIDLLEVGCSEHVLDAVRPSIRVSEWYAARFDCAAKYVLKVALLKDNKKELFWKQRISENCLYVAKEILSAGRDWFKAEHVFKDYPAGVRYIGFFHKGKDMQFWKGHFGAKFTLGSVVIDFSHTAFTE